MPQGAFPRVLETILPLFVMLGLGMLTRKTRLITPEGVSALKSLAVNITLPAVMFGAFATAEYAPGSMRAPALMFVVCAAALGLGFAVCRLLRVPGRLSPYLCTGFEAGMLGYALYALLYPGESVSPFALVDLGQVLFVFTLYKAMLSGRGGVKGVLREAACSPVVWAIAAGLIVGASGLYAWLETANVSGVLNSVTSFVAAPTGAVILLAIGYELSPRGIQWGRVAVLIGLRYGLMALLLCAVILVNRTLLSGMAHEGALLLMFLLPPPYVLPVFAGAPEERASVASALSGMTLVSVLLFAVLAAFGA